MFSRAAKGCGQEGHKSPALKGWVAQVSKTPSQNRLFFFWVLEKRLFLFLLLAVFGGQVVFF